MLSLNAIRHALRPSAKAASGALLALVVAALAGCGASDVVPEPAPPLPLAAVPGGVTAACTAAAEALGTICPALLPAPARGEDLAEALDPEGDGDFARGDNSWLLSWAYRASWDATRPPPRGRVLHVIAGARRDGGGDEDPLRLVGSGGLEPGDPPGTESPAVPPVRLGSTTVADTRTDILAWCPLPRGGTIHAGHQGIVWRDSRITYVVSAHFQDRISPDRRLATLRAVAESFRPVR